MNRILPLIAMCFTVVLLPGQMSGADDVEMALVPISTNARLIHGAFDSSWRTSFIVTHLGTDKTTMLQYPWFDKQLARETILPLFPPPRRTNDMGFDGSLPYPFVEWPGYQGILIRYPHPKRDVLRFSLRIQDVSRQAETWGTEIPVVREGDFATDTIHLIGIPADARFRTMLRVYDIDRRGGTVRIRAYAFDTAIPHEGEDEFLGEIQVDFRVPESQFEELEPFRPGYLELSEIPSRFRAPAPELRSIRLEIDAPDGSRYWAFASITNLATQHVTVVTPAGK